MEPRGEEKPYVHCVLHAHLHDVHAVLEPRPVLDARANTRLTRSVLDSSCLEHPVGPCLLHGTVADVSIHGNVDGIPGDARTADSSDADGDRTARLGRTAVAHRHLRLRRPVRRLPSDAIEEILRLQTKELYDAHDVLRLPSRLRHNRIHCV